MENDATLHYIEDEHHRRLYYRFTPAALLSNFVPLIVILHDKDQARQAAHFEYRMWNVLTPIDNFGSDGSGSCWLGESGDFFVKELLQKLIEQLAYEYECEDHIYFYGSGCGAYGAVVHGILCKANAVYLDQLLLHIEDQSIIGDVKPAVTDLLQVINEAKQTPIFFLNRDTASTVPSRRFADACTKAAVKVRLDYAPQSQSDDESAIKETLDMLAKMASQV